MDAQPKIIWTKEAREDLLQIVKYIAKDSLFYAEKTANNISANVNRLQQYPEVGSIISI